MSDAVMRPSALPPLALLYGTRPQVIKASVLAAALAPHWDVLTVDTGQHYDYALNALLYAQLGVRPPDVCLDVGSGDQATQTAHVLTRAAEVLSGRGARRPCAAVVIGDTNSTLGCALAAAKLRIPVVHVEAGLRCHDPLMAEEINRRAVDAISAVLCAPSDAAAARLRTEGAPGVVRRTGDVARDALLRALPRAAAASDAGGWPLAAGAPFVFATLHRAELVDDEARLAAAVDQLGRLPLPVVFAAHPRTRAALAAAGVAPPAGVHLIPPLGYLEAIAAVRDAAAVVTDSGGLQREAYWLGVPCVTVRAETEWEETVALGANRLLAVDRVAELPAAVAAAVAGGAGSWDRDAYGDGSAAAQVVDAVAGLR
ncbi:UDP-N-acetyl glucosamine 2-epimerase [Gemmatimonadetes bacterium T265]|nr:UDP-N-acetyl glucosamine 2-epimerase [Gemmatimonadetes bacterium T265]